LPNGVKVLDPDIIFHLWPYPTISPDGNWVAYVSKGYVCVCSVGNPSPRRIMEVPNSWTWPHFKVGSEDAVKTGSYDALSRGLERDELNKLQEQMKNTIYGINWTHDSKGFVFGVEGYDRETKVRTYDTYLASIDGNFTKLSRFGPDPRRSMPIAGVITHDGRFLVALNWQGIHRPLIWSLEENKPRATPFLYLTPSAKSGRWLGIEKDTRQLVITDENFEVTKRFDEYRPARSFGFKMDWSPDERFVIWRNQIGFDYYSNWEGRWIDLDSGERRMLEGWFMDENIGFTGRGGEFYRCGLDGRRSKWLEGGEVFGAHLTLVPDSGGAPTDLWRVTVDPKKSWLRPLIHPGNQQFYMSPDASLFAISLSRPQGEKRGVIWHLIDRKERLWRFPGKDNGEFVSPFELAGFAEGGKTFVGYDKSRLFAFPVSAVTKVAHEIKP
jgi:hypothetical protein